MLTRQAEPPLPLLQQRPFRMLTICRFTAGIAQNGANFALLLLITEETNKAFLSGLLVLSLVVPATVTGLVAGVAADVLPKRPILFLANAARAALCVQWVLGDHAVAVYFVFAVVLSTLGQFAGSATGALQPIVVSRDSLAKANAISHAAGGLAQVIGFVVLTPISLHVFDSSDVLFAICAGLFALSALYGVAIGRVNRPDRLELGGRQASRWWLAGWVQIRSDRAVSQATTELTLISAALIVLGGLIPTYIQDTLGLSVAVGALVLMPAAGGIILGLRLAGLLAHRVPHVVLSTSGFLGFVALLFGVTFVDPLAQFLGGYNVFSWLNEVHIGKFDGAGVLAMVLVVPLGFSYALVAVAGQTVLNDRVPLAMQGRVLATQAALAGLASSLPVLVAGALADLTSVTLVMALLAGATALGALGSVRGPRHPQRTPAVVGG